jgi:hypothetical protein
MQEQEHKYAKGYMAMMHVDVMITRLICAYLMHLLIEPEVRQALTMVKYVLNHNKVRGSLVDLCGKIFDEEICFIRDRTKKPS